MKLYLTLILSLAFSLTFSQKLVDVKMITFNNDTLRTKVKIVTNMFDSSMIYGSSFSPKIKTVNPEGKKVNMEASEVKALLFTDFNGKSRVFINNSPNKKTLNEHLFNGKILDWFRGYMATNGGENGFDYLFNKVTNKGIGVGYFTGLPKKKLIEFFSDEPEMASFIEEMKSSTMRNAENSIDVCMQRIITKYESLKAKK